MKRFYFTKLITPIVFLLGLALTSVGQTTYSTPGTYTYTVGTGVTTIAVDVVGGKGGNSSTGSTGGKGGRVQAILAVTAGQVLNIYVGGAGSNYIYCTSTAGGANGSGGGANGGFGYGYGGGGGGGSWDTGTGVTSNGAVGFVRFVWGTLMVFSFSIFNASASFSVGGKFLIEIRLVLRFPPPFSVFITGFILLSSLPFRFILHEYLP